MTFNEAKMSDLHLFFSEREFFWETAWRHSTHIISFEDAQKKKNFFIGFNSV